MIKSKLINPLIHISQDVLIVGTGCYLVGKFVNQLFPKLDLKKSKIQILAEALGQCIVVVFFIYLLKELYKFIPSVVQTSSGQTVKEEYMILGETISYSLILFSTQTKLKDKIRVISEDICERRDIFNNQCS